jgi:ligand-binding SRPBCC domain-containing protein
VALQSRQYKIFIDRPPDVVFAFHTDLKNHPRVSPPDGHEEVLSPLDTVLAQGVRVSFRARHGGIWHKMESEIIDWDPPRAFTDRQISGPFASWTHKHRFVPFQLGTLMTDSVEYETPAGPLGALADRFWLGKHLDEFFQYRQNEAKRLLERIGRIKGRPSITESEGVA